MRNVLFESGAELLELVFYGLVAVVLTLVGAVAEVAASQNLSAGQTTLGAWETGVGLILLYAGYSVATQFVLPRVRDADATEA